MSLTGTQGQLCTATPISSLRSEATFSDYSNFILFSTLRFHSGHRLRQCPHFSQSNSHTGNHKIEERTGTYGITPELSDH